MMNSRKNSTNTSGMKVKNLFLASIHKTFLNQELCSSQKLAVIKMLKKKRKRRDSLRTESLYHCLIQI